MGNAAGMDWLVYWFMFAASIIVAGATVSVIDGAALLTLSFREVNAR